MKHRTKLWVIAAVSAITVLGIQYAKAQYEFGPPPFVDPYPFGPYGPQRYYDQFRDYRQQFRPYYDGGNNWRWRENNYPEYRGFRGNDYRPLYPFPPRRRY